MKISSYSSRTSNYSQIIRTNNRTYIKHIAASRPSFRSNIFADKDVVYEDNFDKINHKYEKDINNFIAKKAEENCSQEKFLYDMRNYYIKCVKKYFFTKDEHILNKNIGYTLLSNNGDFELLLKYINYISPEKDRNIIVYQGYDYYTKHGKHDWLQYGPSLDSFGITAKIFIDFLTQFDIEKEKVKLKNKMAEDASLTKDIILKQKISNAKETVSLKYISNVQYVKGLSKENVDITKLLPNTILIEHKDKKVREDLINWILNSTDCNKRGCFNNSELSQNMGRKKLKSILKDCKTKFEETGIPNLVYFQDLAKFIDISVSVEELAPFKKMLQEAWKVYHTTIIFDVDNSTKIDNIAKQPHRSLHLDIDNDIILERFKPDMINRHNLFKYKDGYRVIIGSGAEDYVDIFLGSFGSSNDILWINTNNSDKILKILKNIDIIREKDLFKDVKKIQCPFPDKYSSLHNNNFYRLDAKTIDGEYIFEREV